MQWHDLGPVEGFQKAPVTLAHVPFSTPNRVASKLRNLRTPR